MLTTLDRAGIVTETQAVLTTSEVCVTRTWQQCEPGALFVSWRGPEAPFRQPEYHLSGERGHVDRLAQGHSVRIASDEAGCRQKHQKLDQPFCPQGTMPDM